MYLCLMKNNSNTVSQSGLIREMGSSELIEYVKNLEVTSETQVLIKKCIACYLQLTGRNLLGDINKHTEHV